jgi:peptide/nickel transport system ATP-binding protein
MKEPVGRRISPDRLLAIEHFHVQFPARGGVVHAVNDVSLSVDRGEVVGLVGESGSGKSTLALSIPRLLPRSAVLNGTIVFDGQRLSDMKPGQLRALRGGAIGSIFQDPTAGLNPLMSVGAQIDEALNAHTSLSRRERRLRQRELLEIVGMPDAARHRAAYPHELSGGMRQRAMIAAAIACNPQLLIADEPTTALDVTLQAQILDLLARLRHELSMAIILVSHDLGVINELADRVHVMYAGRIVEEGSRDAVLARPTHPYTVALIGAIPQIDGERPAQLNAIAGAPPDLQEAVDECPFLPRCDLAIADCAARFPPLELRDDDAHFVACVHDTAKLRAGTAVSLISRGVEPRVGDNAGPLLRVEGLSVRFHTRHGLSQAGEHHIRAVDDVSIAVSAGETLGLVGESGCGKSTLGRAILRILEPASGTIQFEGHDLTALSFNALRPYRARMQMVFQDPYSSLDPRMRIGEALREPLLIHGGTSRESQKLRVEELLSLVHLSPTTANRYPHELSGGQRQRVAIARALATEPQFIVCDEPTSALDVSVQAQIANLLVELQERLHLSCLFISHNLAIVRHLSQRIAVMYLGRIIEVGAAETVARRPRHPYSQALLSAVVSLDGQPSRVRVVAQGEPPSALRPPSGCHFHPRCPFARERCAVERPALLAETDGAVACHFWREIERGELDPISRKP